MTAAAGRTSWRAVTRPQPPDRGDDRDVLDQVLKLAGVHGLSVVVDRSLRPEIGALLDRELRVVMVSGVLTRAEQERALERCLADYRAATGFHLWN